MVYDAVVPMLALGKALQRRAAVDERRGRLPEQRYFGGQSLEEIAEALDVSLAPSSASCGRRGRGWRSS